MILFARSPVPEGRTNIMLSGGGVERGFSKESLLGAQFLFELMRHFWSMVVGGTELTLER